MKPRPPQHAQPVTTVTLLTALLMAPSLHAQSPTDADGPTAAERYASLSVAADHEGLVALWTAHPESAIPVIDGDLEGSLALWEDDPDTNRTEIQRLIARAVAGAHAATEATGRRRILDYVTSFAGWDDDQKLSFRAGQQAFREGRQALRDGDTATALRLGRTCRDLAEPLGDWWGTAMGFGLEGSALSAIDEPDAAVTAMARARLIYRELGLTSSALRIEVDLARLLIDLGRLPRAHALVSDGETTAARLGLDEVAAQFSELAEAIANRQ